MEGTGRQVRGTDHRGKYAGSSMRDRLLRPVAADPRASPAVHSRSASSRTRKVDPIDPDVHRVRLREIPTSGATSTDRCALPGHPAALGGRPRARRAIHPASEPSRCRARDSLRVGSGSPRKRPRLVMPLLGHPVASPGQGRPPLAPWIGLSARFKCLKSVQLSLSEASHFQCPLKDPSFQEKGPHPRSPFAVHPVGTSTAAKT